jgi:hypothetical protein
MRHFEVEVLEALSFAPSIQLTTTICIAEILLNVTLTTSNIIYAYICCPFLIYDLSPG